MSENKPGFQFVQRMKTWYPASPATDSGYVALYFVNGDGQVGESRVFNHMPVAWPPIKQGSWLGSLSDAAATAETIPCRWRCFYSLFIHLKAYKFLWTVCEVNTTGWQQDGSKNSVQKLAHRLPFVIQWTWLSNSVFSLVRHLPQHSERLP